MNAERLRRAVGPALGAFAVLTTFAACADGEERANPDVRNELDASPEASTPPDANVVDAGTTPEAAPPTTCSPGGFCRTNLSALAPLLAISSTSAQGVNDAWAVGAGGIVRWDGVTWNLVHPMSFDSLWSYFGIATSQADDMWMTNAATVVRYSKSGDAGAGFRQFTIELDVAASWVEPVSNELWVVATDYDGVSGVHRLRDEGGPDLVVEPSNLPTVLGDGSTYRWMSIWGFGASDVYVGGEMCPTDACSDEEFLGAIAHYDGTSWSITPLGALEQVNAIFGTQDAASSRQLWLWLGPRAFRVYTMTSIRLVPVDGTGAIGPAIFSKDMPMPPNNPAYGEPCSHVVASAYSATSALISNGCLVHQWDGAKLEPTPTAINGAPLGRVNAIWSGAGGHAWVAGEAAQLGLGFAVQRSAGSKP